MLASQPGEQAFIIKEEEKELIIRTAAHACADELADRGCAYISAPFLTPDRMRSFYADWRCFFVESDKQLFRPEFGRLDGYFPKGVETAKGHNEPDAKEFFHLSRNGLCPEHCYPSSAPVFEYLSHSAVEVFTALAIAIPGLTDFARSLIMSQRLVMRIAYYEAGKDVSHFAAAHEDINFLTIFPRATSSGLQYLSREGTWNCVEPQEEQCAVIAGDMLAEALNGRIPATRHRVVPLATDRLSISFFLNPDDDTILSHRWTAGEFMNYRLHEIGIDRHSPAGHHC